MKAFKIFLFVIALFFAFLANAQVAVTVNIGTPPMWGPAGYSDVQYYYLPDVYSYYDVRSSMFIYQSGGVWVHRTYLPVRYRNYDLYHGYKVVMTDYHGNTPYIHYKEHKHKYAKGYKGPIQKNIGERPGNGRSVGNSPARNQSPKASGYNKSRSNENGSGNSKGKGNTKNLQKGNSQGNGHGKK
jgi:hypothetical protein